MPVNVLRKKGAKMSLREALDRVEKLKSLAQSSNPHEASVAVARLEAFNIEAARYPKREATGTGKTSDDASQPSGNAIEVLDELPDIPHRALGEIEACQPPEQTKVNWDELHAEIRERANQIGADALVSIHLKGTVSQRILCATAIRYLSPVEIAEIQQRTKLADDEKAYYEEQKERRDEANAPPID